MGLRVWCTLISRAPLRLLLYRREPLLMSPFQWAERNALSALHTESPGWMLVYAPPPTPRPTLEKHSSSRQNKRLLRAGALCLLFKMNQTLYELGLNSVGCAVSPQYIPFILPPPTPTPGSALLRFLYLISASWRPPGLTRQSRCPGTEPAGHSLASADESCEGQEAAFLGELGQLASFRAPGE